MIEWLDDLKNGFETFRLAIGLARDVRSALPSLEANKAIDKALDQAERSAHLAETQIAKSLGYVLCKCTFSPQIMLSRGCDPEATRPDMAEYSACPKCGKEVPSEAVRRRPVPQATQVRRI